MSLLMGRETLVYEDNRFSWLRELARGASPSCHEYTNFLFQESGQISSMAGREVE